MIKTTLLKNFLDTARYSDGEIVGNHDGGGLRLPIDFYDSMSPFVEVKFKGGDTITVGNNSLPNGNNTAVIKSFQYSAKPARHGCTVEVEIHDIEGGNFALWFERINKSFKNQMRDYAMQCRFGWVGISCGEETSTVPQSRKCDFKAWRSSTRELISQKIYFLPKILHANYEQGKIKFKIEGIDLIQNIAGIEVSKTYGTKGNEITLKCAIIDLMKDAGIPIVEWKKKLPNGNDIDVGFFGTGASRKKDGRFCAKEGNEGIRKIHHSMNRDPLITALEWMKAVKSPDGKAFIAGWNPCSPVPHLIFWEDDTPKCECKYEKGKSLGTYLVNGGRASPVIQFTPKTKWAFAGEGSKGGIAGTVHTAQNPSAQPEGEPFEAPPKGGKKTPRDSTKCQKFPGFQGGQKDVAVGYNQSINEETNGNPTAMISLYEAQQRANKAFYPIEAQLKIQGDPSFVSPIMMMARFIGIIVVNPIHYRGDAHAGNTGVVPNRDPRGKGCGEWLISAPPVNPVFSNKGWMIRGVTHQIKEGKFNTTLDVFLPSPGFELDANIPIGCEHSGGSGII